MSRCVILSAGPVEDSERLRPLLKTDDWFIAADGGGRLAAALGVKPAVLVADFDSSAPPDTGGDTEIVRLPMEKDWTDTQAAAMLALDRGYRDFLLLGCTGGRLDHTASNLVLLEWIAGRGGLPVMVDEDNEVRFLEGPVELRLANRPPYRYLSLIPLDRTLTGVTLRGLKYPLTDARLTRGDTLSVSNEPQGSEMTVSLASGRALLIRSQRN